MKEILPNIWAVEIYDHFDFRFEYSKLQEYWVLVYKSPFIWEKYKRESCDWACHFDSPPKILFQTSTMTEDDCRGLVDWYGKGDGSIDEAGVGDTFWCYDGSDFCFDTAIDSMKSLLSFHGLTGNCLIIKKEK